MLLAVGALVFNSCSTDDKVVDDVFDGTTNGAVLRTISLISNEIPIGLDSAIFSVELEEQDNQDGALLESMDVFVTFTDGSPDEGDSTGALTSEVFLMNVPASSFSTDTPFGLPRYTLTITAQDFINAVGLSGFDALFGGDTFTTRLELNLTDGRVFSDFNAGGIITGGFFASPFRYNTPVVCPVEESFFTGEYLTEQITPSIFGYDTFDPDGGGVILEFFNAATAPGAGLAQPGEADGLTSTQRAFDGEYLATLGFGNPRTYIFDFVCGEIIVPGGQTTGLACGGASIVIGPPTGDNGTYDFMDDTIFSASFTDDVDDACGAGGAQVTLLFTKQ